MELGHKSADSAASPMPRRALRKGTHSCAECKRRKTRCFFETSGASKCVSCKRRGLPCISQEFVDVPSSAADRDTNLAESLERMQNMLAQIMQKTALDDCGAGTTAGSTPGSVVGSAVGSAGDFTDSRESALAQLRKMQRELALAEQRQGGAAGAAASGCSSRSVLSPTGGHGGEDTCTVMYAALPSQQDINVLFQAGRIAIYVQALCNSYSSLFAGGNAQSLEAMAVLPPATTHPVVLARKLLHVALCIQQLDPSFDEKTLPQRLGGRPLFETRDECFRLATDLVTCHDELLDSVEGVECMLCESVYLVNSGNLRRSMISLRRALTLIQVMGLHREKIWRQHDPDTQISGQVTWSHLAYLERFLALHLGIPTAVTGTRFGSRDKRPGESAAEWIERLQIDICEFIMQRNNSGGSDSIGIVYNNSGHDDTDDNSRALAQADYATTRRIDEELNRVVDSLPASWWAPLEYRAGMTTNELMECIINAQIQIVHYSLVVLLHLPFLLRRSSSDSTFTYSKAACTFAAREILRRFISFRTVVRVVYCCRPIDFCALTASLVLLIAHLSGQRHSNSGWLLPHHRLGDRVLIQQTIETMEELTRVNNDDLSRQSARLARRLLDLEAGSVHQRTSFYQSSVPAPHAADMQHESDSPDTSGPSALGDDQSLLLNIPYFGAVKLTRQLDIDWQMYTADGNGVNTTGSVASGLSDVSGFAYGSSFSNGPRGPDISVQSGEVSAPAVGAFLPSYGSVPSLNNKIKNSQNSYPAAQHSSAAGMPSQLLQVSAEGEDQFAATSPFSPLCASTNAPNLFLYYNPMPFPTGQSDSQGQAEDEEQGNYDVPMPDLMAGVDDWAFQGVDATFFDSIIRGSNLSFPPS